jgi:hypothetical protein
VGGVGGLEALLGGAGRHPGLDRLDLGDVAGDRDLGVVLGAGLLAVPAFGGALLSLLLFAGTALGLALGA